VPKETIRSLIDREKKKRAADLAAYSEGLDCFVWDIESVVREMRLYVASCEAELPAAAAKLVKIATEIEARTRSIAASAQAEAARKMTQDAPKIPLKGAARRISV
jgi:hypothetical protein